MESSREGVVGHRCCEEKNRKMWDFNRGDRWILLKKTTAGYNAENNRLWGTHLELMDQVSGNTRKILRDKEPEYMLQDSVFYILQRSYTHDISTIWLPKPDLCKDTPTHTPVWIVQISQGSTPR